MILQGWFRHLHALKNNLAVMKLFSTEGCSCCMCRILVYLRHLCYPPKLQTALGWVRICFSQALPCFSSPLSSPLSSSLHSPMALGALLGRGPMDAKPMGAADSSFTLHQDSSSLSPALGYFLSSGNGWGHWPLPFPIPSRGREPCTTLHALPALLKADHPQP